MQVQEMKLTAIKPYENNPRKNDPAVDAVAASIKEFGWQQPIVVDRELVIIAGHTRWKAAKKLKCKVVPVLVAEGLTEEQVAAYRLADNKSGELAEWDEDMLFEELAQIGDIDMTLFGFEALDDFTEEGQTEEDDIPEVDEDEPATSVVGEIYQLGRHRLMCGDSTSPEDVGRLMDGKRVGFVFTDPPWNVNYGDVDKDNPQGYKPRKILNDFMGTEEFKDFMFRTFQNMKDFSLPGAMVYVVMSAQEWGNMMLTLAMNDFHWSSTIIWNKDNFVMSRKDYHTRYEPIWYGWHEGEARLHPLEDRKQCDVWDIPRPKRSDEHPTMKPVELVVKAIKNSSKKDTLVLDLFGGSGTTIIAAEQTGRTGFAMELDPKYCDVIRRRWAEYKHGSGCDWRALTPAL